MTQVVDDRGRSATWWPSSPGHVSAARHPRCIRDEPDGSVVVLELRDPDADGVSSAWGHAVAAGLRAG